MCNTHHLGSSQERTEWDVARAACKRSGPMMLVAAMVMLPPASSIEGTVTVPDALSASDWSGIRAAYDVNRHAAFETDKGYQAHNPGQRWRTRFQGRSFLTTPDAGGWSWGLELLSHGREGAERFVDVPSCIHADGERVNYEWDETLTEWYVNDRRGLEHGYTVHQRPEVPIDGVPVPYLRFTLAVRGNLRPRVCDDARNMTFVDVFGAAVVNYSGLTVYDAEGAFVPAWFEAMPASSTAVFCIVVDDTDAIYPLTIDPIGHQAYLKASNTDEGDFFGSSVSISGDTVVVGARGDDSSATGVDGNQADNSATSSGAAYVFVREDGRWSQQAYLKASNTGVNDRFGSAVFISGDTVVVGALQEDSAATGVNGDQTSNGTDDSGAVYVFTRGAGVWRQEAYLKASNTGIDDRFGARVSVSGNTVVVGAEYEDGSATGVNGNPDNNSGTSGAAYVFVRDGSVWSQQAYLKASNTVTNNMFGSSVAISGDTVVVGAVWEGGGSTGVNGDENQGPNGITRSGAAYVFVRDAGGVWSQQAYLKASNTGVFDEFGISVAVSGDTVVVGAHEERSSATGVDGDQSDNSATDAGAAYVFVRDAGGVWSQQAYLKASNTEADERFGASLAVSGDTVVVGATGEDSMATGIDGDQADNSASGAGAAYVFVRNPAGIWSQQAYLKASNTDMFDSFGRSVSVSGNTAVVGAYLEDSSATGVDGSQADNGTSASGAAYVFTGLGLPPPLPGDMNCDTNVDLADMQPFVQALLDPPGYAIAFPICNILNGDMQPDGHVDGDDVQEFVNLLVP
ncbi:MAG: FG-GAP repeat protein [Phycisphaerales bacterium]|nr:FG-GAP repeat protein [Phycisphaerales bacterium]